MSIKVAKNDFTRKDKYFGNMGDSGKLIVAAGFEIVAQSPINRPIWSHWLLGYFQFIVCDTSVIINTHIVL